MKHSTQVMKTQNGVEVLFVEVPGAEVVSCAFHLLAGDAYVKDRSKYETAHIMEHLAFGANARFPSMRKSSAAISKNGASTNASTSRLSMIYEAECAKFDFEDVFDLMMVQIESPLHLEAELKAEIGNVRDELIMRWDNPDVRLGQSFAKWLGQDIVTFKESLETLPNIQRSDIVEHWQRTHVTSNMRVLIAGHITETERQAILDRIEGTSLKFGTAQSPKWQVPPKDKGEAFFIPYEEATAITIDASHTIQRKLSQQEKATARVMRALAFETQHSRVYGRLREEGLAYHIQGGVSSTERYSSMGFDLTIDPDQLHSALEVISQETKKLATQPATDSEVEKAINYCVGSFAFNVQTVGHLAGGYANEFFKQGNVIDYSEIPKRFKKATAKMIMDLVNEFQTSDNFALGSTAGSAHRNLANSAYDLLYLKH